jgi:fatty-acyl-CoA synthase
VHVKIVNPVSHAVMPANTEGEVWIGGPKVMKEYWHNAAASAAVLVDLTDPVTGTQHRYMRSGDLGYLDDDGYLFLSGRIKDVVNLGDGFCYSCVEVEDAILSEVTGVAEVAVAGVPSNAGDRAYAWILLKSGCNPSDFSLMNVHAKLLARGVISKAKLPHVVEVVTSFPKNDSGKIMKPALIASALKSPL